MNKAIKYIKTLKWNILVIFSLLILILPPTFAQEKDVKLGILALRGPEKTIENWTPTAEYLSDQISEYTFSIVPLGFEEIYEAVKLGEVDFVFANPSIYIELVWLHKVYRIATLINVYDGQEYCEFGSVIFIKKSNQDISDLKDLKNRSFMNVHETSSGGWRMALREFKKNGIDPYLDFKTIRNGKTHDNVVYAVQNGDVDAGAVRTGILETMHKEGFININDFTVLNQQFHNHFSLLLSTPLYPEWPFIKVKHTSDKLAKQVSVALLSMSSDDQAAKSAGITGWTIPHTYQLVLDCHKELGVIPYENIGKISIANFIKQYHDLILFVLILVIGIIVTSIRVIRLNRKLKEAHKKLEEKVKLRTLELSMSNKYLSKENTERKLAEAELQKHRTNLEELVKDRTAEIEELASTLLERKEKMEKAQEAMRFLTEDVNSSRDELHNANEKLISANKELEAFTYSVSHDLRAPLRAVIGYSNIFMEDHENSVNTDGKKVLDTIVRNTQKMQTLIDDLLKFSRIGRSTVSKQTVNTKKMFQDKFNELSEIEKNRKINFTISKTIPNIQADKVLLNQLIQNIVGNAIKYTSRKEIAEINVDFKENNDYLIITISDNGVGFDEQYKHKLFEVFQRLHTDKEFEGTGIGLSIVAKVAQKHGWELDAESKINDGAKFYIKIKRS